MSQKFRAAAQRENRTFTRTLEPFAAIEPMAALKKLSPPAGYKKFSPAWGETVRIYGGTADDTQSFAAQTTIDVAMLSAGQSIELTTPYLAYVAKGDGQFETTDLTGGDLIRGADGAFTATTDVQFILVGSLT